MKIEPTGPGRPRFDGTAAKPEAERFQASVSQQPETSGAGQPPGVPPGVTQADLRDPAKAEAIVSRCFDELVDNACRQLEGSVSEAQRSDLREWLSSDPLLRGKLLRYLEQVVK